MISEDKKAGTRASEISKSNPSRDQSDPQTHLCLPCREAIRLRALSFPVHQLEVNVEVRKIFAPGRPAVNGEGKVKSLRYGISIKVEENKAAIERAQRWFGCFVIRSNMAEEGESAGTGTELLRADQEQNRIEKTWHS